MKGSKLATLTLLLLSLFCFFAAPAVADGTTVDQTKNQNGQSSSTVFTAVEDPGGQNSTGVPPHGDDWGGWGNKPGEANRGKGQPPHGPGSDLTAIDAWMMAVKATIM